METNSQVLLEISEGVYSSYFMLGSLEMAYATHDQLWCSTSCFMFGHKKYFYNTMTSCDTPMTY
jgi:hypothetical protein